MTDSTHKKFSHLKKALSHLPVSAISDDVVRSVEEGNVTLLTGRTGSGKTLDASTRLADASGHQVVVLVPRRFLAVNAAHTVANIEKGQRLKDEGKPVPDDMGDADVGKDVGYGIGKQVGSEAIFDKDTNLVFATYGYALRNRKLLNDAKTVVCDEVHEKDEKISLVRGLLHDRLRHDKSLRVVEMSATLDADKQGKFWEDIAPVKKLHAEGKSHECQLEHEPQKNVVNKVGDLLKEGKKGIAVFRAGITDVETTRDEIQQWLQDHHITDVEVAISHGDLREEDRTQAAKPPAEGMRKIIIGTNVIESGANMMWLDSGVSDGYTKIPYYRDNGAEALCLELLPKERIIQQMGRLVRNGPAVMHLCNPVSFEDREQGASSEILRVSLKSLAMDAAGVGKDPTTLKYDVEPEEQERIRKGLERAKKDLMRLGVMRDDWTLTEKGDFVHTLPLTPEAASMLWKLPKEKLPDAVLLAAVQDMGGLRADYKESHKQSNQSDVLDGYLAMKLLGKDSDEENCLRFNVGLKQYEDVLQKVKDVSERLQLAPEEKGEKMDMKEAVQLLISANVNNLFERKENKWSNAAQNRGIFGKDFNSALRDKNEDRFATGYLRAFPTQTGTERTVLQNVTRISKEDLCDFILHHPEAMPDLHFEREASKGKRQGSDKLIGRWFGGEQIEMSIPRQPKKEMQALLKDRGYKEYKEHADAALPTGQPSGGRNQEAWDAQAKSAEEKRESARERGGSRKDRKHKRHGQQGGGANDE